MGSCDLKTGQCSNSTHSDPTQSEIKASQSVQISLFTDPICSHCWVMEPSWRKLLYHYEGHFSWRYVYGGLLPHWEGFADSSAGISKPSDVYPHWKEISEHYGQPIDPSVWLHDPISSSYPASEAVHVVRILDSKKEDSFLRRVRHAVFMEAKNISRFEVLGQCAADIGLNQESFLQNLETGLGKPGFRRDIEETQKYLIQGFPTLLLKDDQNQMILHGSQSFEKLENALLKMTGLTPNRRDLDTQQILLNYGSGTTREFSEILERALPETTQLLQAAGAIRHPLAGDALWKATKVLP